MPYEDAVDGGPATAHDTVIIDNRKSAFSV
jgi:hypothetical protein